MELKYCKECIQMTNHNTKGICLKCRRQKIKIDKIRDKIADITIRLNHIISDLNELKLNE